MLEDFLAGTASMARKRHLTSTARGFLCFCLMAQVTHPFYPFNPWQRKNPEDRCLSTSRRILLWLHGSLFVLPTAAILFSGGLEGPARQDWELRHRAAAKTRLEQRPMTEGPRRYAS